MKQNLFHPPDPRPIRAFRTALLGLTIFSLTLSATPSRAQGLERRTRDQIKQAFKQIETAAQKAAKGDRKLEGTLALLNQYRYLCGVPHDVGIKKEYTDLAQAAAKICAQIGAISHSPTNPGWPEKEYETARTGAASSSLAMGTDLQGSILVYMFDSDPSNISRLGHRRGCINPAIQYTGFGSVGRVSAMYVMDASRETGTDYDFISFPPPGLMPADMISNGHAWHLSLNPRKYTIPNPQDLKITLLPLRKGDAIPRLLVPSERALKIDDFYISQDGMGIPNAIIFRSSEVKPTRGQRYAVILHGLKDAEGQPKALSYAVEFF